METTDEQLRNIVKIYLKLSTGKLANDGFLPRINLDKALVEETRLFYEGKSNEVIVQTNLIDYLRETDKFYTQEKNRVTHIINWEIGEEILKTFRQEMLVKPQPQLLSKGNGFKDFIQDKRYDEIALLYQLYKQERSTSSPSVSNSKPSYQTKARTCSSKWTYTTKTANQWTSKKSYSPVKSW